MIITLIKTSNNNNNNIKTVHELIEYQSIYKSSDSISVIFEDEQISYNELNKRSNILSNYLSIQLNICQEDLIAICLERSIELIVSIIGILKSGAAYVPIDPNYPIERQKFMLT